MWLSCRASKRVCHGSSIQNSASHLPPCPRPRLRRDGILRDDTFPERRGFYSQSHRLMSTKVKILLGVLAGATGMFLICVLLLVAVYCYWFNSRRQPSPAARAVPPPVRLPATEPLTPSTFNAIER